MPLDQDVVNLAKAIRQHETGNRPVKGASGELASRYQYLPSTWRSTAQKYLGNANAPLTLENENKATYLKLLDWKKAGYNPAQIASMWNSGKPDWEGKVGVNSSGVKYDVPKYVKSVYSLYQQEKSKNGSSAQQYQQQSNVPQPAKDTDTASQSISKAITNTPSSLASFAKGMLELFNPFNTGKTFAQAVDTAQKAKQEGVGLMNVLKEVPGAAAEVLVPQAIRQAISGNLGKARKSLVNDPAGTIIPVLGAKSLLSGKKTVAETKPGLLKTTAEKAAQNVKPAAEYITSKATGLEPGTIRQVVGQPERFTPDQISLYDRTKLADSVMENITKLIEEKKDTGTGYNLVRQSQSAATIPTVKIKSALSEFGIALDNANKIVTTRNTKPMSQTDLAGIQSFIDTYIDTSSATKLTANEFLNAREALSNLAKFDASKTKTSEAVAMKLRATFDEAGKAQIKELKALDESYAPKVKQYNQIKKEFLEVDKATGEVRFKSNALTKIANATNKGRENALAILEEIKPGITEDINILKAMEDIQRTEGNKVGTYMRVLPAGAGYAAGGLIGAVIGAVLASPQIIIPLLRMLGTAAGTEAGFVTGVINKLKAGKKLTETEKEFLVDAVKFSAVINNLNNQEGQPEDKQQNNK